jgi:hypothetical protein
VYTIIRIYIIERVHSRYSLLLSTFYPITERALRHREQLYCTDVHQSE